MPVRREPAERVIKKRAARSTRPTSQSGAMRWRPEIDDKASREAQPELPAAVAKVLAGHKISTDSGALLTSLVERWGELSD